MSCGSKCLKGGFFMYNIDDLIQNIQDNEIPNLEGTLDAEAQQRIEKKVLEQINSDVIHFPKRIRRKLLKLAIASILILAFGLTCTATKKDWDSSLFEHLGISASERGKLKNNDVQTKPSDTCSGVTLTAVSSIGDRNIGYIRINTDYEIPDNFDPETNFITFDEISVKTFSKEGTFHASEKAFLEDNKLCFFINVSDSKNIRKSTISISIGDILLYHSLDDFVAHTNGEVLVEGTWNLNCKYQYTDSIQSHRMLKKVQFQNITYYITKIELSKLSIRISAFVMPDDMEKNNSYRWVDQIELKDGTILPLETYTPCSQKNRRMDYYIYFDEIGQLIDVDNVKALVIFGERVEL